MLETKEYTKRPVDIEAVQYFGPYQHADLLEWIGEAAYVEEDGVLYISTLEGVMKVTNGDFIIKGVADEFYPCKPAIFNETYREKSPDLESTTLYADGQPVAKITTGPTEFQRELQSLINKHSLENGSDTPDFILASFLENVLVDWNHATRTRDRWRSGT